MRPTSLHSARRRFATIELLRRIAVASLTGLTYELMDGRFPSTKALHEVSSASSAPRSPRRLRWVSMAGINSSDRDVSLDTEFTSGNQNPLRGCDFRSELKSKRQWLERPYVVRASMDLGYCLKLLSSQSRNSRANNTKPDQ